MQEVIDIPNCSPKLPTLYRLQSHPLAPVSHGRLFLWKVNTTVASAQETFNNAANYGAPPGGPASIGESLVQGCLDLAYWSCKGFLVLQPGDYLFARDTTGSCDPKDDVLVGFQVNRYAVCHYSPSVT
jgi:hypothetical protein